MIRNGTFCCSWCGDHVRAAQTREITGTEEIVCRWCCSECAHCGRVDWPGKMIESPCCSGTICKTCVGKPRAAPDPDDLRDRDREKRLWMRSCDPERDWCGDEPTWSAEAGIWTE